MLINDQWLRIPVDKIYNQLAKFNLSHWRIKKSRFGRHYLVDEEQVRGYSYSLPVATIRQLANRLNGNDDIPMFDFRAKIAEFEDYYEKNGFAFNNAKKFGTVITPTEEPDFPEWRVLGIYHLSGDENGDNHNVFLKATCDTGNFDEMQAMKWDWEGRQPNEAHPDVFGSMKAPELVDIPIFAGVNMSVWVQGGERVKKINGMLADPTPGNSFNHHSFFVCFRKVGDAWPSKDRPSPPTPLPPEPEKELVGVMSIVVSQEHVASLTPDEDGLVTVEASIFKK